MPTTVEKINEDTYIEDITRERPDLIGHLAKLGIVCQKCSDPFWGTIGELCRLKNLDVNEILNAINSIGKEIKDA